MKNKAIFLILSILLLLSCKEKINILKSKENKNGGIYEMSEKGEEFQFFNNENTVTLNTKTFISFQDFENLYLGKNEIDRDEFQIVLNDAGTIRLKDISNRNIKKQLYFVVDDKIVSAPILNSIIESGVVQMGLNEKETKFIRDYFLN